MIYTGIGSRKVPHSIYMIMVKIAKSLQGATVRSGAATGSDSAFEQGATSTEIFLPWAGFNDHTTGIDVTTLPNYDIAREIVTAVHPAWKKCSDKAKLLHTRNVYQILGESLESPTDIVICWTPDGANGTTIPTSIVTGGTATAINIAANMDIMVLNIKNENDFNTVMEICGIAA